MYTEQQPQNPFDLLAQQNGPGAYDVMNSRIHTDPLSGRVAINTDQGLQEAPTGLVLQVWYRHEDGTSTPHLAYVHATEGVQPLRYREDGSLPHDVAARIASLRVNNPLYTRPNQSPEAKLLSQAGNYDYYESPTAAAAARWATMRARARSHVEFKAPQSRFAKVVRGAASLVMSAFGVNTGRHHRPRNYQPRRAAQPQYA